MRNLLITKLSDMGVPAWLLRVVIGFLTHRHMVVRYKGKLSGTKYLPGGGPQGTLLGLLLFIVLINDVGFGDQHNNIGEILTSKRNMQQANLIHLKYVDDLTLAEAIDLPNQLEVAPSRQQPDCFHARTGHYLPERNSAVCKQLVRTAEYAVKNDMLINHKKTKAMIFNPCNSLDFMPNIKLGSHELEVVQNNKLLGINLTSDLKWSNNTQELVKRANKRIWIIRRLKKMGASSHDLVDMYIKQIRNILELAVPAWQGALTLEDKIDLERIQKSVAHIILGENYQSYEMALFQLNLESLESRRNKLCLKFARKAEKHPKFQNWFKLADSIKNTRQEKHKYLEVKAKHSRLEKSPIAFLTRLLNQHYMK